MADACQRSVLGADASAVGRLYFVDVLRVALIAMVIVHHAAQAYGPTGGFWPVTDPAQSDWFRPFFSVNAAVGLGLLFLLAGSFVPAGYDRKGAARFVRDRLTRIGVPLLVFAVVVHLPLTYLAAGRPGLDELCGVIFADAGRPLYLHLWFLGHLLLYSAVYVLCRLLVEATKPSARPAQGWAVPTHVVVVGFVVGLAVVTWLVRWRYSIDEWVGFGLILPMEPARMPQYVSLFIIGMVAYRGNWLHRLPVRLGLVWLGIGVMASAGVVATQALLPGLVDDYLALEGGGRSWPALLRSTLEALIAAGLSLGLLVLFRSAFRRPRPLLATMAKASYPAYILHVYLVVGLQAGILSMPLPGLLKFATVAVFGVALSFGVGHWCGQVPGLRTVLGTKPASPPTPDTITVRRS